MSTATNALCAEATVLGKYPFVYKWSANHAIELRKKRWLMIHMADDAIICSATFTLEQPPLRTLRRKLRNAQKLGVIIRTNAPRPWVDLQQIDLDWQTAHGLARGGSTGRFDVGYLSNHLVAWAEDKARPCAFATFQVGTNEWGLDVMRHTNDVPSGTMHALVYTSIKAAQRTGTKLLSLASTPACTNSNQRLHQIGNHATQPRHPLWRWLSG